jgi:DNA-binding response OmpR family regulator
MIPKLRANTNPGLIGAADRFAHSLKALDRPQLAQQGGTVLIADNDPEALSQVAGIVDGLGFEVIEAADGHEARRALLTATDFVAGIFELVLPHVSGPDLLRHMMRDENMKTIPVIIMTRSNSAKLGTEVFSAGARAFLPKPFKATQLQALLMAVVGKRRAAAVSATIKPHADGLRFIN